MCVCVWWGYVHLDFLERCRMRLFVFRKGQGTPDEGAVPWLWLLGSWPQLHTPAVSPSCSNWKAVEVPGEEIPGQGQQSWPGAGRRGSLPQDTR